MLCQYIYTLDDLTLATTFTTFGRLTGNSNPLRASSAKARQPPCHDPSPWKSGNQQDKPDEFSIRVSIYTIMNDNLKNNS